MGNSESGTKRVQRKWHDLLFMDQDHENISRSPFTPKSKGNVINYKAKFYNLQRKAHDHFLNIILMTLLFYCIVVFLIKAAFI